MRLAGVVFCLVIFYRQPFVQSQERTKRDQNNLDLNLELQIQTLLLILCREKPSIPQCINSKSNFYANKQHGGESGTSEVAEPLFQSKPNFNPMYGFGETAEKSGTLGESDKREHARIKKSAPIIKSRPNFNPIYGFGDTAVNSETFGENDKHENARPKTTLAPIIKSRPNFNPIYSQRMDTSNKSDLYKELTSEGFLIVTSGASENCTSGELRPDETDCSRYYKCDQGKLECPYPKLFDSKTLECVDQSEAVCGGDLSEGRTMLPDLALTENNVILECTAKDHQSAVQCCSLIVSYPGTFYVQSISTLTGYYQCKNSKTEFMNCPSGSRFDVNRATCRTIPTQAVISPNNVLQCTASDQQSAGDCCFQVAHNSSTFYIESLVTDDGYYQCRNSVTSFIRCPPGTKFDVHRAACRLVFTKTKSSCDPSNQGGADKCCVNLSNGSLIPDVTNCNTLFKCQDGLATRVNCSKFHSFDKIFRTCVPSAEAMCATFNDI